MRNIFPEHPLDMCTKLMDIETSLCKNSIQTSSPYIYASANISAGSSPCIIKEEAACCRVFSGARPWTGSLDEHRFAESSRRGTTALRRNLLPFHGALMGRASLCYYSVCEAACRRENWLSIDFFRMRANTGMLCSCKLSSWVSPKVPAVETRLLVISVISSTILSSSQLSRSENTCESAATRKVTTNSGDRCVWESWTESCRLVPDTFKTICF